MNDLKITRVANGFIVFVNNFSANTVESEYVFTNANDLGVFVAQWYREDLSDDENE